VGLGLMVLLAPLVRRELLEVVEHLARLAGRGAEEVVAVGRWRAEEEELAAAAEDADGVELLVLLIVRLVDRDDDRAAVVREAPQRADDVRRVGPAQARRRLVEDEQRRVRDELDGE